MGARQSNTDGLVSARCRSSPPPGKEPLSTSPSRTPASGSEPQRLTLLLVEDNLPDALLVGEVIQAAGLPLELHIEPDGELALEFFSRAEQDPNAPRPQLLLLDLKMPKVNGFEVLEWMKQKDLPDLRAAVLSSSDHPNDIKRAYDLGACFYFVKPNVPDDLTAMVRKLVETGGSTTATDDEAQMTND